MDHRPRLRRPPWPGEAAQPPPSRNADQAAPHPRDRGRGARGAPAELAFHEDPPTSRRRFQAVAPEGHRRSRGLVLLAHLDRQRHRLRPNAAQLGGKVSRKVRQQRSARRCAPGGALHRRSWTPRLGRPVRRSAQPSTCMGPPTASRPARCCSVEDVQSVEEPRSATSRACTSSPGLSSRRSTWSPPGGSWSGTPSGAPDRLGGRRPGRGSAPKKKPAPKKQARRSRKAPAQPARKSSKKAAAEEAPADEVEETRRQPVAEVEDAVAEEAPRRATVVGRGPGVEAEPGARGRGPPPREAAEEALAKQASPPRAAPAGPPPGRGGRVVSAPRGASAGHRAPGHLRGFQLVQAHAQYTFQVLDGAHKTRRSAEAIEDLFGRDPPTRADRLRAEQAEAATTPGPRQARLEEGHRRAETNRQDRAVRGREPIRKYKPRRRGAASSPSN